MGKRTLFAVVVILLSLGLSAVCSFGAVKNEKSKQPSVTKNKEMTKEEMLATLKEDLVDNEEVFNMVPELKSVAGKDSGVTYTYNGISFDGLSKEDLAKLYSRVRQAVIKIRTDNIQRQLEIVRQADRLRKMTNPPQPPRVPAAPQSAPRVPQPPPAAQRR